MLYLSSSSTIRLKEVEKLQPHNNLQPLECTQQVEI